MAFNFNLIVKKKNKKKNVSHRKYSVNMTSNLEPAVASHDCGIMVMWLPSQSFKNLQFFLPPLAHPGIRAGLLLVIKVGLCSHSPSQCP